MAGRTAMKALIFGASGQDGQHLAGVCRARGIVPIAVSRSGSGTQGDVAELDQVRSLVRQHAPEYIFHLAATSTTRHEALFENHGTISTGTLNVLETARLHCPRAKIFLAGSGVQFVNAGAPISERTPFHAASAYAVARIQAAYAGRYFRSVGLAVYIGYLFHHESPARKPCHVSQVVASAARRVGAGAREQIELGDVNVEKEWTFAGDVARAILTLVDQDAVFEAAIGSGTTHTIQEWVETCFRLVGRDWREHVQVREGFVSEYQRLVSDPSTIRSLGWEPRVGFDELARMMVGAQAPALGPRW